MIYQIDPGLTPAQLASVTSGELRGCDGDPICSLSIDSREKNTGGVFVCIAGERFDGHDYIAAAAENGALCVITEREADTAGLCEIRVKNTERALGDIAAAHLDRIAPYVVAVTGSVGKTTTKQFLHAVLSAHMPTHRTEGNFNNQIGVPLTVLGLRPEHRAAVLELGMNHRGEIARLSEIVRPDIAVITNIGNSHIEYLGSREGIRDAKMEITRGLKPGGHLLLNGDEPLLWGAEGAIYLAFDNEAADYRITNVRSGDTQTFFDLVCPDRFLHGLEIPVAGRHNVYDAAIACAVGLMLHIPENEIRSGLLSFANTGMRQKIYESGGVTLIEDCYNASPESMKAAISVLCETAQRKGGRTVAILGDMRELGDHSTALHKEVGAYLAVKGVDVLFTFGEEAVMIAAGAMENGLSETAIHIFRDASETEDIGHTLRRIVCAGDTVLFKASRALEMERLIPYLNS